MMLMKACIDGLSSQEACAFSLLKLVGETCKITKRKRRFNSNFSILPLELYSCALQVITPVFFFHLFRKLKTLQDKKMEKLPPRLTHLIRSYPLLHKLNYCTQTCTKKMNKMLGFTLVLVCRHQSPCVLGVIGTLNYFLG